MSVDPVDVIDPATYVAMFKEGPENSRRFVGVCGRVVRGTAPEQFTKLSFFPDRRLAWLIGPDGLRSVIGCSGNEVLNMISKSDQPWLNDRLAEGMRFKLIVMPQMECRRADWEGVLDMVEKHYPEIAPKIHRWRDELRKPSPEGIAANLLTDDVKSHPEHALHMTAERYLTCDDTAANARVFLLHSLGMNEKFVGDGFTLPTEKQSSVDEYLTANVPLATISGHIMIDLDVKPSSSSL